MHGICPNWDEPEQRLLDDFSSARSHAEACVLCGIASEKTNHFLGALQWPKRQKWLSLTVQEVCPSQSTAYFDTRGTDHCGLPP